MGKFSFSGNGHVVGRPISANVGARSAAFPTITDCLAELESGEFRLVSSADVGDLVSRLANLDLAELVDRRLILLAWERLPLHTSILHEAIDQLAAAALVLWPDWYLAETGFNTGEATIDILINRAQRVGLDRHVLPHWLELADRACQTKRAPRWPIEFTAEVEARQLALALGERACKLVLAVRKSDEHDAALLGLARAVEWLAQETKMSLLILVPHEVDSSTALDSISFRMIRLDDHANLANELPTVNLAQPAPFELLPPQSATTTRPRLLVRPIIGRPHRDSIGEQLLWEKLQTDVELAPLFLCNQRAPTVCASAYLVDFIWRDGKLIVEVDGFYWHSSPYSFSLDRRRDYELHLSGHVVMRLPHDEVVADVDGAVEKIRRMVHMRRNAKSI